MLLWTVVQKATVLDQELNTPGNCKASLLVCPLQIHDPRHLLAAPRGEKKKKKAKLMVGMFSLWYKTKTWASKVHKEEMDVGT